MSGDSDGTCLARPDSSILLKSPDGEPTGMRRARREQPMRITRALRYLAVALLALGLGVLLGEGVHAGHAAHRPFMDVLSR